MSAFAQSSVTITGKFGVAVDRGLGRTTNVAVTDGDVNFAAVEDLGSGMKAGATIGLRTRGRENTQAIAGTSTSTATSSYSEVGRDATVFVSGGFGTVTAGSIELGNGISGNGWAGTNLTQSTDLNNGGVLSSNAYSNILQYASPKFSGFQVSVTRADSIGSVGVANSAVADVGGVTVDNERGLNANLIGLTYANGPLTAAIDQASFGTKTATSAAYDRSRTRYSAAYDFGMAKVGFGIEDNKGIGAGTANQTFNGKQTTFGISAPLTSKLRVGVIVAKNTEAGALSAANAKAKGTGLAADYSLSKRTTLNFSTSKITRDDTNVATKEGKQARLRLMHAF